jgi:hypothetical protein
MGWVVNSEHRQKHPWILEPGEPVPEVNALPVLQPDVGQIGNLPYNGAEDRANLDPWQRSILEQYDL